MVVVAWKLYEGLREITYHSEAISSQIDDLLKDPR